MNWEALGGPLAASCRYRAAVGYTGGALGAFCGFRGAYWEGSENPILIPMEIVGYWDILGGERGPHIYPLWGLLGTGKGVL